MKRLFLCSVLVALAYLGTEHQLFRLEPALERPSLSEWKTRMQTGLTNGTQRLSAIFTHHKNEPEAHEQNQNWAELYAEVQKLSDEVRQLRADWQDYHWQKQQLMPSTPEPRSQQQNKVDEGVIVEASRSDKKQDQTGFDSDIEVAEPNMSKRETTQTQWLTPLDQLIEKLERKSAGI